MLLLLWLLFWLEGCNLAMEGDEAKLRRLDCDLVTEKEEDDFAFLEGWLSAAYSKWNSYGGLPLSSG
jgi:hypothetical protein